MPPRALPAYQRLDAETALKVRGTPAHRRIWREVASEFQLTETQFARTSIIILLRSLAKHEPKAIARAVKRANQQLADAGMPTITAKEILNAEGLPEFGLLTWSELECDEHAAEHEARLPKFKRIIRAIFSPLWG